MRTVKDQPALAPNFFLQVVVAEDRLTPALVLFPWVGMAKDQSIPVPEAATQEGVAKDRLIPAPVSSCGGS